MLDKDWEDMSDAEKDRVRKEEQEKFSRMQPISASANLIHADNAAVVRKIAFDYWKRHYPNDVQIDTIIGDVKINTRSIKDSLAHGVGQKKLDVIPTLKEGMERAAYIGVLPDFRGRAGKNHYFLYKVKINDENHYVICRVKENFSQNRLYIHEVAPEKVFVQQKSDTLQTQPADESHLQLRGIALYKCMITNFLQGVNGSFTPTRKKEKNMVDYSKVPSEAVDVVFAQENRKLAAEIERDKEKTARETLAWADSSDGKYESPEEERYVYLMKKSAMAQLGIEPVKSDADVYHQEIANSLTVAEESLDDNATKELRSIADDLHTSMKNVEEAEQTCGADQETWDGYVPRHEDIIRSIEKAGDAKSEGKSDEECSKAIHEAQESMREGTTYMQERCELILKREKEYQEQMEALRRRVEDLEREREMKARFPENFARCIAASAEFFASVHAMREEARHQPHRIASDLFAASRKAVKETCDAVKRTPDKIKDYLETQTRKAVNSVLLGVAGIFDKGIAALGERRAKILEKVIPDPVPAPKKEEAELSPAERSFLAEKEALLAQHKKWNPAYTVRTAKKLAEQGFGEKEIAAALQKHAPDIQNLPNTDLRQNAAARIAKSAAGSVRVGQQEQNKEKSR